MKEITDLARLRDQLAKHFNLQELQDLCFDLDIQYDDLPGLTQGDKARGIIQYCQRHNRLDDLIKRCMKLRPNVSWEFYISSNGKEPAILIIGSGTAEKVLHIEDEWINLGQKHLIRQHSELYGGSGVDYTFRLGSFGYSALPILAIGDDWHGRNIQKAIVGLAKHDQITRFVESPDFLPAKIKTQQSTIVVAHGVRTTFGEELKGAEYFSRFTRDRLNQAIDLPEVAIKAVMVGHIHADNAECEKGEITKDIINRFVNSGIPIFANFGRSQYGLGNSFWRETLKKVTVFQLAIDEAREFFKQDGITSLRHMIEWFQQNEITAVITLEKMGAIATLKDGRDGVTFAKPYDLKERLVDPTGAGDAFGAGLVSYIFDELTLAEKNRKLDASGQILDEVMKIGKFEEAISRGRDWAAFACTTLGAANSCPDADKLADLSMRLKEAQGATSIRRGSLNEHDTVLWLIDQAF